MPVFHALRTQNRKEREIKALLDRQLSLDRLELETMCGLRKDPKSKDKNLSDDKEEVKTQRELSYLIGWIE